MPYTGGPPYIHYATGYNHAIYKAILGCSSLTTTVYLLYATKWHVYGGLNLLTHADAKLQGRKILAVYLQVL